MKSEKKTNAAVIFGISHLPTAMAIAYTYTILIIKVIILKQMGKLYLDGFTGRRV